MRHLLFQLFPFISLFTFDSLAITREAMAQEAVSFPSAGIVSDQGIITGIVSEEDKKLEGALLEKIRADPKSEQAAYNYAEFLFNEDRLEAALEYAKRVLQLNPEHLRAKLLVTRIEELQQLSDALMRRNKRLGFIAEDFQQFAENSPLPAEENLITGIAPAPSPTVSASSRLRELDAKYGISRSVKSRPLLRSLESMQVSARAQDYIDAEKYEEAEKLFSVYLQNNPEDYEMRCQLIEVLLLAKRYDEALERIVLAPQKFAGQGKLAMYRDGIERINNSLSTEGRKRAELALLSDLTDAQMIESEALLGAPAVEESLPEGSSEATEEDQKKKKASESIFRELDNPHY